MPSFCFYVALGIKVLHNNKTVAIDSSTFFISPRTAIVCLFSFSNIWEYLLYQFCLLCIFLMVNGMVIEYLYFFFQEISFQLLTFEWFSNNNIFTETWDYHTLKMQILDFHSIFNSVMWYDTRHLERTARPIPCKL